MRRLGGRGGVLALAAVLLASTARGQVTVNPQALEPTTEAPPTQPAPTHPKPTHPAPPHVPPPIHAPIAHPKIVQPSVPRPPAPPRPAPLIVPPIPPPPPVLAPLSPPPPAHPVDLPPLPPVVPDAVGTASEIPNGVRITFAPGSASLNPTTSEALHHLGRTLPDAIFTLNAYSQGQADDPSTPRRLSLDRALAARSILMAEGIPSTHIVARGYPSAPGPSSDPADRPPADRVDVITGRSPTAKP